MTVSESVSFVVPIVSLIVALIQYKICVSWLKSPEDNAKALSRRLLKPLSFVCVTALAMRLLIAEVSDVDAFDTDIFVIMFLIGGFYSCLIADVLSKAKGLPGLWK